jgi:hypothetical protein
MRRYDVDIFDPSGEHLATVTVYGDSDEDIDAKLSELPNQLRVVDQLIESEQAFASLEDCDSDEKPETEDWTDEEDEDEDEDDEDDGDAYAVGVEE